MIANPTAVHCNLLTRSRKTSTASGPLKTMPLSRKGATRPIGP